MSRPVILISCEHAVNTVPEPYQAYFMHDQDLLKTHRGIDFGALTIATHFSKVFACHLMYPKATRLLVDCNRQLSNPTIFSKITRGLPLKEKQTIIQDYYLPYRKGFEAIVRDYIAAGKQVWHVSVHSFSPVLDGKVRKADIGLLYDPKRLFESALAKAWRRHLKQDSSGLHVRMNYPYAGIRDGFTSFLRKAFKQEAYLGIEIEINQSRILHTKTLPSLCQRLSDSFQCCMDASISSPN